MALHIVVISPEHPLIETWKDKLSNMDEIRDYQKQLQKNLILNVQRLPKKKTGVELKGVKGINPLTQKRNSDLFPITF